MNDDQGQAEEDHGLGLSGVDRGGEEKGEQGHVPGPVPTAHDEDRRREQPTPPRHRRGVGPPQPPHERTTQLVHRGGGGRPEHPEAQHPGQDVGAGAGDEQGGDLSHGVGEADGEEVPQQGRHAERGGLPVEHQRHPETAVGIPQG